MNNDMRRCVKCILPESYLKILFDEKGVCNYCNKYTPFTPMGEDTLVKYFEKAEKQNCQYDALVPLSGGKDSTYILYLAKKKYSLNILSYTFDNGFLSNVALQNIDSAVKKLNVDHIFYRPNQALLMKLYKAVLLVSGELCSVCGIGLKNSYCKIAADWNIPLILRGDSLVERNSYTPEDIYNIDRFKTILSDSGGITESDFRSFIGYYNKDKLIKAYKKFRGIGRIISPLYYIKKPGEEEIVNIISEELDWRAGDCDKGRCLNHKHIDCVAERFSNYIREQRFGYSRRVCQLSNLIRMGELSREQALAMLNAENPKEEPEITDIILGKLNISRNELAEAIKIKSFKY
ncbi:MAG: hypothetical protein PHQ96_00845 [Candidatus Omnitrophica bacterium]|nr:hypothetical protein [Candidatus Omnitrophota bacterium]